MSYEDHHEPEKEEERSCMIGNGEVCYRYHEEETPKHEEHGMYPEEDEEEDYEDEPEPKRHHDHRRMPPMMRRYRPEPEPVRRYKPEPEPERKQHRRRPQPQPMKRAGFRYGQPARRPQPKSRQQQMDYRQMVDKFMKKHAVEPQGYEQVRPDKMMMRVRKQARGYGQEEEREEPRGYGQQERR